MIDFLRGKPVLIDTDYIIMDVCDIGYQVFCANPYEFAGKSDSVNTIYIHHHVREDLIQLFGFATRAEQALFRKLLDVNGIGPRVALGILSGGAPVAIVQAIQHDDLTFLTRLPGIGKKTAQRMILDLKDKLESIAYVAPIALNGEALSSNHVAETRTLGVPQLWLEAKEALLALGYSEAETERAWRDIKSKVQATDGADHMVKLALQSLYRA
jgi:Holliday junction DNA helicase RuvA